MTAEAASPGPGAPAWRIWLRAIAQFVSLQLVIQFLGFATGLLLIRLLSPGDLGLFTLMTSALATVQLLADTGTGSGLAALGGRCQDQPARFAGLLRAVDELRRRLSAIASLAVVPIYFAAARRPDLELWPLQALLLACCFSFWAWPTVKVDVLSASLRLRGDAARAQAVELGVAAVRLAAVAALNLPVAAPLRGFDLSGLTEVFLFWLFVLWGALWFLHVFLLRRSDTGWSRQAQPEAEDRRALRGLVRAQLGHNLLFVSQGQLAVLLAVALGSTAVAGEFGALSRLAAVFTVFNALQNGLILPAFARLAPEPALLRRRFAQVTWAGFGVGAGLWWLTWLFPQPLLWLLGAPYAHLEVELAWLMAAHALLYLGSVLWSLNYARGWVQGSWAVPLAALAAQGLGLFWIDAGTARGAAQLLVCSALPALPLQWWLMHRGLAATASSSVA
ncbi:MAG: hypothetical protein JSR82_15885 [Verrucomicrobia bacterium]|nr:hypothetical protein [Verrucomicrobiota bacterium]